MKTDYRIEDIQTGKVWVKATRYDCCILDAMINIAKSIPGSRLMVKFPDWKDWKQDYIDPSYKLTTY